MSTKGRFFNNYLEYYESTTHERMLPMASLRYVEDFLGAGKVVIPAAGSAESGVDWTKSIVGIAPPTVAGIADAAGGIVACTLTSDSQAQTAALYHGDQRNFDVTKSLVVEMLVNVNVLPTLTAELVWGLVGDYNAAPDSATYSAFFTCDGSGEVFCEVDDNASDQSATSGVTLTADTLHVFRIDFTDVTSVKFFIDGAHVASSTTFTYAATGANAVLQPFFSAYKASGAGVGTLYVDKVHIWGKRS